MFFADEEVEAAASEPQPTPAKRPKPEAAAKPTKQLPELQDIYELAASFGVDNSSESSSDAELLSDNENADN